MWLIVLCWWAVLVIGLGFISAANSLIADAYKARSAGKNFGSLLFSACVFLGLGLLLMLAGITYPMVVILKIAQALNV